MKNLLSRINYLQIDNKKLKDEIESLKKTTNKDLQEQLQSKINEINILNKEKKELKEKFNEYKYADKTINEYKNKNLLLRETIDRLNIKHDELLKKINNLNEKLNPKKEENKDPKKMNEKKKLNEQRSSSVINIKKEKEKEKENEKEKTIIQNICDLSENNTNMINENINIIKSNKNINLLPNNDIKEKYITLLKKHNYELDAYRIFYLYSLFNDNKDFYRLRYTFNKWKKI
jgi:hypothetical protein